jgi:hypothetical protein
MSGPKDADAERFVIQHRKELLSHQIIVQLPGIQQIKGRTGSVFDTEGAIDPLWLHALPGLGVKHEKYRRTVCKAIVSVRSVFSRAAVPEFLRDAMHIRGHIIVRQTSKSIKRHYRRPGSLGPPDVRTVVNELAATGNDIIGPLIFAVVSLKVGHEDDHTVGN